LKSLEPPLQYIENFQSPPFNARKYFGAPSLNIFIPPLGIINVLSLNMHFIKLKSRTVVGRNGPYQAYEFGFNYRKRRDDIEFPRNCGFARQ
jgi:hypothetical protein